MKHFLLKLIKFPIIVVFLVLLSYILITFGISAILAAILPSVEYYEIIETPAVWIFTFMLGFIGAIIDSEK